MAATKVTIDFSYDPAEMVRILEHCIATGAREGTEYTLPGGRSWKSPTLTECHVLLKDYRSQVSTSSGRVVNYVRFSN